MLTLNKKNATIKGLLACGFTEEPGRSRKYRTFVGRTATFLVGKSGAFRRTYSTIALSRSLTGSKLHDAFEYVGRFAELNPDLTPTQYIRLANAHKANKLEGLDLFTPTEETSCLDK